MKILSEIISAATMLFIVALMLLPLLIINIFIVGAIYLIDSDIIKIQNLVSLVVSLLIGDAIFIYLKIHENKQTYI